MLLRLRLSRQRRRAAEKTSHAGLAELLGTELPAGRTPWRDVRFVAVDLETTGLDTANDEIIAAGWAPVERGVIRPGAGGYCLIRSGTEVGQSATVHGLTDTQLREGESRAAAFDQLIAALKDSVMVVHHAPLDVGMLNRLSQELAGAPFAVPVIDTLAMARERLERQGKTPESGALRLETQRTAFGLPRYSAHHGLTDAIATAELFTAMVKHRFGEAATFADLWP